MTSDRAIRASDRDREFAAEILRDAYAAGRLELEEFYGRTGAAYSAKTWGELRDLTVDLPSQVHACRGSGEGASRHAAERYQAPRRPFAPMWVMIALLLAVAAGTHLAVAAIALIPLALLAHCAAGQNYTPVRPPAVMQPEWTAPQGRPAAEARSQWQHPAEGAQWRPSAPQDTQVRSRPSQGGTDDLSCPRGAGPGTH